MKEVRRISIIGAEDVRTAIGNLFSKAGLEVASGNELDEKMARSDIVIECLPDDEEEYETFLEILRDAGEAWGSGQAGIGARQATPFHVLFAVSEGEKAKRAHWGMKEINVEPARKARTRQRSQKRKPSRS